jgi:urease accessory protein
LTPLLRLLQLASPALPIGAFAYSQGLEAAVDAGWVSDEESAHAWIVGLLDQSLASVEVPVLARQHRAFAAGDAGEVRRWNDVLRASRGAAELQAEDQRLGGALARLLETLGIAEAAAWVNDPRATHATVFALACVRWEIPLANGAAGLLFAWAENQVGAACRLVPLGQSAGQRILSAAVAAIPDAAARGLALGDDEIGFQAARHAVAAARHETQYSRIFRS